MVERITQEYLKSILHYDPETGWFIWTVNRARRQSKGKRAGWLHVDKKPTHTSYRKIEINTKPYGEHQLAWLYMTGEWPKLKLDHKNLDGTDNRWDNLRLATNAQNSLNRKLFPNSKSGHKGVYWYSQTNRWVVQIVKDYKCYHFGYYTTLEEAVIVHKREYQNLHGVEFTRC